MLQFRWFQVESPLKATNDVADMLSQAAATEALKVTNDVADMLSQAAATEKKNNREYLLKIISSIRFLGRQGLPLRGDGPHMIWIPTSIGYCYYEQRTFKTLMFLLRKKS